MNGMKNAIILNGSYVQDLYIILVLIFAAWKQMIWSETALVCDLITN